MARNRRSSLSSIHTRPYARGTTVPPSVNDGEQGGPSLKRAVREKRFERVAHEVASIIIVAWSAGSIFWRARYPDSSEAILAAVNSGAVPVYLDVVTVATVRRAPWGLLIVAAGALVALVVVFAANRVSSNAAPKVPDLFGRATLVVGGGYTASIGDGDQAGHIGPAQLRMGDRAIQVPRRTPIFSWCNFIDTGYERCVVQVGLRRNTDTAQWIAAFEQPTTEGKLPYRRGTIVGLARHRMELSDGTTIPVSTNATIDCGTPLILPRGFATIYVDPETGTAQRVVCVSLA
jgi:hypothetical protein